MQLQYSTVEIRTQLPSVFFVKYLTFINIFYKNWMWKTNGNYMDQFEGPMYLPVEILLLLFLHLITTAYSMYSTFIYCCKPTV